MKAERKLDAPSSHKAQLEDHHPPPSRHPLGPSPALAAQDGNPSGGVRPQIMAEQSEFSDKVVRNYRIIKPIGRETSFLLC